VIELWHLLKPAASLIPQVEWYATAKSSSPGRIAEAPINPLYPGTWAILSPPVRLWLKEDLAFVTLRAWSIAVPAYPKDIAFNAEANSEPPDAAARAVTPDILYPSEEAVADPKLDNQNSEA